MLPFLGRKIELDAIVFAAQDAVAGEKDGLVRVHVQGSHGIGKSQFVKQLASDLAGFDKLLPVLVNLSNPRRDRFQHLISIRRRLQSLRGFEADAFDFAAVLFDLEFRDGTLTVKSLQSSEFSPSALLREGVSDASKDGGKVAWEALGSGGGAGIGSFLTNSAHELLAKSLEGGAVALGTATSILIAKLVISGAIRHAKKRKLFARYPDLRGIAEGQILSFEEFDELLPILLGDAIADFQNKPDGKLPCILVDPADSLACGDADHPSVAVGAMLETLLKSSPAKLLLSTSRDSLETRQSRVNGVDAGIMARGSEICLRGLPLPEVQAWLISEGVSPTALPDDLLRDSGTTVWPLGLAKWWGKVSTNPPKETEGEPV